MSFSGEVKEELNRRESRARHCQIAELAAILHFCGSIASRDGANFLVVQAENESVIRKCFTLLEKTFNIGTDIKMEGIGRSGNCSIRLDDPELIFRILQGTKFLDSQGRLTDLREPVNGMILKSACCQRAFLRGAFLSVGSMSDPEKSYHLELVCSRESQAEQIRDILHVFEIEARIVARKKYFVVYLKEGASISDFLGMVEAPVSVMNFENFRIVRDMRNSINRRVNCETANIGKTVSAASRQVEDILLLQEKYGFGNLPDSLREMAEIRLEYPDAPLRELGGYLNPPVGKSGVNHRLRKLSEIADRIRM